MNSFRRCLHYCRRHGWRATVARGAEAWRRGTHFGRMMLFACPLPVADPGAATCDITCVTEATIDPADRARLLDVPDPVQRAAELTERFAAGAQLWLAHVDGQLAGYGWALRGATMEPHYFPLQPDDVHLFDFFVFEAFRGRGINPALVGAVVAAQADRGARRAHLECRAWNEPQLRSLRKTPFRRYAAVTKLPAFGRTLVIWSHDHRPAAPRPRHEPTLAAPAR